MTEQSGSGYLLTHFVEDPEGFGERVYFSISDGDDPTAWNRLNGGMPILESQLGTTGIRDPYIVRGAHEFFIIATDLRVFGGDGKGWDHWKRHGSRSIIVWRSTDLINWSEPWSLEVAPPTAGMAWAPEAVYDPLRHDYLLFWSSTLFPREDHEHATETYSRVLAARTADFTSIYESAVMIDDGVTVIDTTLFPADGAWHRISKEDSGLTGSRRVFHQIGSAPLAEDFTTVEERIADSCFSQVEGPLVFREHRQGRWFLFVDQFEQNPQGYIALSADDPRNGWSLLPTDEFRIPAGTKHGGVLPLYGDEWIRLAKSAWPSLQSHS